eukprot:g29326.t1
MANTSLARPAVDVTAAAGAALLLGAAGATAGGAAAELLASISCPISHSTRTRNAYGIVLVICASSSSQNTVFYSCSFRIVCPTTIRDTCTAAATAGGDVVGVTSLVPISTSKPHRSFCDQHLTLDPTMHHPVGHLRSEHNACKKDNAIPISLCSFGLLSLVCFQLWDSTQGFVRHMLDDIRARSAQAFHHPTNVACWAGASDEGDEVEDASAGTGEADLDALPLRIFVGGCAFESILEALRLPFSGAWDICSICCIASIDGCCLGLVLDPCASRGVNRQKARRFIDCNDNGAEPSEAAAVVDIRSAEEGTNFDTTGDGRD